MNFFNLLISEHKEAKGEFKALLQADEPDKQRTSLLCQKLLLHMEMEEKYFYPEMEQFKALQELSEEAQLEHAEAKKVIKALLNNKLDNVEYKVKLELLQLAIEHHIEEEEKEIIPLAEKKLKAQQVEEITNQMVALKEKKQASLKS